MQTKPLPITIRDLVKGYQDTIATTNPDDSSDPGRIVGYKGKLNIRPPYQRNFVYQDKDMHEVIRTISHNHPLGVMYWMKREDGGYEVLDGQQRIISIARFVAEQRFSCGGLFDYDRKQRLTFGSLEKDEQDAIMNYDRLLVYECDGTPREREKWFKTINIGSKTLTEQEMRNSVYYGDWLDDAKKQFSYRNCAAHIKSKAYLKVDPNRQLLLEIAIKWIAFGEGYASDSPINDYMAKHRNDKNAKPLYDYFCKVIDWVQATFPEEYDAMQQVGADWGELYHKHKDRAHDAKAYQSRVAKLMADEDIEKKSGIYEYILTGHKRHLNIRAFKQSDRQATHERQGKKCNECKKRFALKDMEADHIQPWSEDGPSILKNCQMLCKHCHADKTAQQARARAGGKK